MTTHAVHPLHALPLRPAPGSRDSRCWKTSETNEMNQTKLAGQARPGVGGRSWEGFRLHQHFVAIRLLRKKKEEEPSKEGWARKPPHSTSQGRQRGDAGRPPPLRPPVRHAALHLFSDVVAAQLTSAPVPCGAHCQVGPKYEQHIKNSWSFAGILVRPGLPDQRWQTADRFPNCPQREPSPLGPSGRVAERGAQWTFWTRGEIEELLRVTRTIGPIGLLPLRQPAHCRNGVERARRSTSLSERTVFVGILLLFVLHHP